MSKIKSGLVEHIKSGGTVTFIPPFALAVALRLVRLLLVI